MLTARATRMLHALAHAVRTGRAARLRFRDTETTTVERTVDILGLAFDAPRWLVVLYGPEGGALRVLGLERIDRVRATRRRAGPRPVGFDPVYFAVQRYLDPDAGPPRCASLVIDTALAEVAQVVLPTGVFERHGADCACRVSTSRLDVLAALADSLGARAELDCGCPMPAPKSNRQKTPEARLLGLASFILSQPEPVTREQIYEAFPDEYGGRADRAEKKFTRDKDALRRLGFNLEIEPLDRGKVGYLIDARSSAMPSVEFTPEEAAVLWTAGAGTLRFSGHPLRDDLESALRKLLVAGRGLPPRAAATEELVVQGPANEQKMLAALTKAWENRKRVKIAYWRVATDEVVEREVDLYGWASRRGEWILVGYCHLRKAVRIFYLSRIRSVVASRTRDPDYEVPDDFDIRRWSRQQVWDYDVHPPLQAVIRFRGSLAKIATALLPIATVTTAGDGARVARVEVRNLRGLVRQALAWGPEAELVEPPEGRATAREILAAAAGGATP